MHNWDHSVGVPTLYWLLILAWLKGSFLHIYFGSASEFASDLSFGSLQIQIWFRSRNTARYVGLVNKTNSRYCPFQAGEQGKQVHGRMCFIMSSVQPWTLTVTPPPPPPSPYTLRPSTDMDVVIIHPAGELTQLVSLSPAPLYPLGGLHPRECCRGTGWGGPGVREAGPVGERGPRQEHVHCAV
jgi:hypothetical protein